MQATKDRIQWTNPLEPAREALKRVAPPEYEAERSRLDHLLRGDASSGSRSEGEASLAASGPEWNALASAIDAVRGQLLSEGSTRDQANQRISERFYSEILSAADRYVKVHADRRASAWSRPDRRLWESAPGGRALYEDFRRVTTDDNVRDSIRLLAAGIRDQERRRHFLSIPFLTFEYSDEGRPPKRITYTLERVAGLVPKPPARMDPWDDPRPWLIEYLTAPSRSRRANLAETTPAHNEVGVRPEYHPPESDPLGLPLSVAEEIASDLVRWFLPTSLSHLKAGSTSPSAIRKASVAFRSQ